VRVDTPDDVYLYNNAGLEYADVGDHETALTWLTRAWSWRRPPVTRRAWFRGSPTKRAQSLAELGRREDRLQRDADQFLAHPPPHPPGGGRPLPSRRRRPPANPCRSLSCPAL